jgi:ribosomal-protein-alanine N-acetyltransferase
MAHDGACDRSWTLIIDRLCLRQIQMADSKQIYAFKSDPEVTLCYGQEPHRSIEETSDWVQRGLSSIARREAFMWVITLKDGGNVIGECCFWNIDPDHHCAEIGYELHPTYWHQGIMSEALSAILDYGLIDLGLHRIESIPLKKNKASHDLLSKLGFKHEGTLRERLCFRDHHEDQLYFGLLKDEWMSRSNVK